MWSVKVRQWPCSARTALTKVHRGRQRSHALLFVFRLLPVAGAAGGPDGIETIVRVLARGGRVHSGSVRSAGARGGHEA